MDPPGLAAPGVPRRGRDPEDGPRLRPMSRSRSIVTSRSITTSPCDSPMPGGREAGRREVAAAEGDERPRVVLAALAPRALAPRAGGVERPPEERLERAPRLRADERPREDERPADCERPAEARPRPPADRLRDRPPPDRVVRVLLAMGTPFEGCRRPALADWRERPARAASLPGLARKGALSTNPGNLSGGRRRGDARHVLAVEDDP